MNDFMEIVDQIVDDSKSIKPEIIAKEVMAWLINNVENYIDSDTKSFKLDLVLDSKEGLLETQKLQELYRSIPDNDSLIDAEKDKKLIDKCEKCRRILDEVTAKAYEIMKNSNDDISKLFNKMIFFYERIIPSPENKKRAIEIDAELKELFKQKELTEDKERLKDLQNKVVEKIKEGESLVKFEEFDGTVDISNFSYDAFEVGVKIVHAKEGPSDTLIGDMAEEEKVVAKEYIVPEGFTVWIELHYRPKLRPTTMF